MPMLGLLTRTYNKRKNVFQAKDGKQIGALKNINTGIPKKRKLSAKYMYTCIDICIRVLISVYVYWYLYTCINKCHTVFDYPTVCARIHDVQKKKKEGRIAQYEINKKNKKNTVSFQLILVTSDTDSRYLRYKMNF